MTRKVTPDILDELFGTAAPVGPAMHTAVASTATPPTPRLSGLPAIDAAHLTPAVYRTAVRLLARAEPSGVLFVGPEDGAEVFSNGDYGAQRAHLYHLKRAGLIDYSHCAGWFVRFLAPLQNRALALQNGNGSLQNGALALQNGAEE